MANCPPMPPAWGSVPPSQVPYAPGCAPEPLRYLLDRPKVYNRLWDSRRDQVEGKVEESRMSGRTTANALLTIAQCIDNPNVWVHCNDHHQGKQAARHLCGVIESMVQVLGLEFFEYRESEVRCNLLRVE